ncbi:sigma-54-dependent transcriptional regulator [Massilia sp. SM-13]|uniref:sigma-54-dependent transcriptional regulator n=1 Tax=Pseudoduganella rhizocola TaxID=3382643 RepID=UPI0038B4B5ED
MQANILILEDDADVAYAAQLLLRRRGATVGTLADPALLPQRLKDDPPDLVLLDMNFTPGRIDGEQGMQVLQLLRHCTAAPAVIVMTAYANVALAVEAMKLGAFDFITKPWNNERLAAAVDAALAQRTAATGQQASALMGDSAVMKQLRRLIASVAPTEANVLILGENGVGKELAARAIHDASRRAAQHFLPVDMGSLPESTLESELFGHRKGSFTDARADRAGRFQAASGGTLFLDEIGNLPLPAQAKLLTALERREVTPLGADRAQAIDVRIVSATNLAETALYDAQLFRPDLLFRLNTIVLRVPPLRERREDIPLLLNHYLAHYQQQYGKPARAVSPAALSALCAHAWPGNVRALRHACERAVILCDADAYRSDDFGLAAAAPDMQPPGAETPATRPADTVRLDALERGAITAALDQVQGNISRAARLLGVSRAALYRKLEKHGL